MTDLALVASAITLVLAVARVVRLVVDDTWPPINRAKAWWIDRSSPDWQPLVECPFCVAPYVALPAVGWYATVVAWPQAEWNTVPWWIINGWAAVSYLAAMVTVRDIPPEGRE